MNSRRSIYTFLLGFIMTTIGVGLFLWYFRKYREIVPRQLIVSREQPDKPVESPRVNVTEHARDRLEEIRGIGPATARRLNEAGIYTYHQLGQLTSEDLQDITGATRWNPIEWITEARKLADGS
jgi:predicted flap endonuclease-1-like 5' DNA nuclease